MNRPDKTPAKLTREEALVRMADLCARSEQCPADIGRKLRMKGLAETDIAAVIDELTDRKFLDTARFARSFANDKLKFAGWGRVKIKMELKARRIDDAEIAAALEGLDPEIYDDRLMRAARGKGKGLDLRRYADRGKLVRSLTARGFTISESMDAARRLYEEMSEDEEDEE